MKKALLLALFGMFLAIQPAWAEEMPTYGPNTPSPQPVLDTPHSLLQPVYRFWSSTHKAHFYTMSKNEKKHIEKVYSQNVWRYEGVACKAFREKIPNTAPVYRFWSNVNERHFYTMNKDEKDALVNGAYPEAKWCYEGIAWYAEEDPKRNNNPVYRFYSQANKVHFYTMSKDEKDALIKGVYQEAKWRYEGIAWYGRD